MPIEIIISNLYKVAPKYIGSLKLTKVRFLFCLTNYKVDQIYFFNLIRDIGIFSLCVLTDIVGVDYPSDKFRFSVYYNLLSIYKFFRIIIISKVSLPNEDTSLVSYSVLTSLASLYSSATWLERENWDMLGIFFSNNYDLRRILTDYGFEGFPLRKDFPLTGFLEVRYDDEQRSVVYEELELTQEFRFFDFESPWRNER